jgi:hypothetical protein
MTNKRIRYSKVKTGVLLSRRNFTTSSGQTVVVYLDLNTKNYQIVDAETNAVVATGGDTTNSAILKIQAKQGLVRLGVSFTAEARNRGGVATSEG